MREPIEHNNHPVNDNVIAMHECVNAIKEKVVENKGGIKWMLENTVCQWICKSEKPVEEFVDVELKFNAFRTALY